MVMLAISPCWEVTSHCKSEKSGSHHPPSLWYSFPVDMHSSSELITHNSWDTILWTRVQCLHTFPFAFSLTDSTHFQVYFGQTHIPLNFFRKFVSCIFNAIKFSCHTTLFLGIPNLPNEVLKFALIKVHYFVYCKVLWILMNV